MAPPTHDVESSEAEDQEKNPPPRHDDSNSAVGTLGGADHLVMDGGALGALGGGTVGEVKEALRVNLDPSLLVLLREVHYLSQPPFEIRMPDSVKDIIRSMDFQTLRSLSARLEAIVAKYNYIMRSGNYLGIFRPHIL